jgi:hypothetical protein
MYWSSPTLGDRTYRYALYSNVDTIIGDTVYQVMFDRTFNEPYWQERYFVRSGDDGKGYLRFPGSATEYLTGDLGAAVGDTVRDVFVLDRGQEPICGESDNWKLVDFIVDSIVTTISQIGYQTTRHYVQSPCRPIFGTNNQFSYWEPDMGSLYGPCITWSDIPVYMPYWAVVNDTIVGGIGLLGGAVEGDPANGVCDLTVGLSSTSTVSSFQVRPNPTHGRITVDFSQPLQRETYYSVLDATGRLLYQRPLPAGGTEEDIDLSRFGPGTFILSITDPDGQRNERVVVE